MGTSPMDSRDGNRGNLTWEGNCEPMANGSAIGHSSVRKRQLHQQFHQQGFDMADLKGKIGIVTGGGTGIGRATALAMAKSGAALVIGNRDAAKGEEVVQQIRQAGGRAVFQKTDVSKHADVKALVERSVA